MREPKCVNFQTSIQLRFFTYASPCTKHEKNKEKGKNMPIYGRNNVKRPQHLMKFPTISVGIP